MGFVKLDGAVSIASNSYGVATGYGQQVKHLTDKLVKHGATVGVLSNYGLEGSVETIKTPTGKAVHYPRGFTQYSEDVIPMWHDDLKARAGSDRGLLVTLYDPWVYQGLQFDDPILAWTPIDHVSLSPRIASFLLRPNVTPVAMAPHGVRQLSEAGLHPLYVPHSVDTKVFKPTPLIEGIPARDYLGVAEDAFLVGMVAANKANGIIHRKAFAENLLAFAQLKEKHPDAQLYLHTEVSNAFGGFKLLDLLKTVGLSDADVVIADWRRMRVGYPPEVLAGMYSAMDVLLAASYGEGFGVPTVEAQACGTRVIGSSWAATPDLVSDECWLVAGQPLWNEPHRAWMQIPLVGSIVGALELAYEADRGTSSACVEFASRFDVDRVWDEFWLPIFAERLG